MRQRLHGVFAIIAVLCGAAPALAEQELPIYPGTVHTRIGNDLIIQGEYYRIAYFTTKDSMKTVASYFHKHWEGQGYPTFLDGDFVNEGVVSAFYTREGLLRSVVLRVHAGKTVGFTVLKDLWLRQKAKPQPALVPLEGSLFVQDLAARDEPGSTQHRSTLVEAPMIGVRDQLGAKMKSIGFSAVRETGSKSDDGRAQLVLEWAKAGEQVVVALSEVDEGMTAVSQTWVGSDRPDAFPNDEAVRKAKERHQAEEAGKKKGGGK